MCALKGDILILGLFACFPSSPSLLFLLSHHEHVTRPLATSKQRFCGDLQKTLAHSHDNEVNRIEWSVVKKMSAFPCRFQALPSSCPFPSCTQSFPRTGQVLEVLTYAGGASLIGVQLPVSQYCRIGLPSGAFER